MNKKNAIQKNIINSKLLNSMQNVEVNKSNCKFCQSKFRKEAEELFEKKGNMKLVHQLLTEKGETVGYLPVRNHLLRHYLGADRMEGMRDWAEEVEHFSVNSKDRRLHILERIAIMRREMCVIAAANDTVDAMDDRRKNADIVKKLSDGISQLEDRIALMDDEMRPVEIIIENLRSILATKIKRASNEDTKRVLMETLEELSESVENILIEDGTQ